MLVGARQGRGFVAGTSVPCLEAWAGPGAVTAPLRETGTRGTETVMLVTAARVTWYNASRGCRAPQP